MLTTELLGMAVSDALTACADLIDTPDHNGFDIVSTLATVIPICELTDADRGLFDTALDEIRRQVGPFITAWNDDPTRTRGDVVTVLRRAADAARATENTEPAS